MRAGLSRGQETQWPWEEGRRQVETSERSPPSPSSPPWAWSSPRGAPRLLPGTPMLGQEESDMTASDGEREQQRQAACRSSSGVGGSLTEGGSAFPASRARTGRHRRWGGRRRKQLPCFAAGSSISPAVSPLVRQPTCPYSDRVAGPTIPHVPSGGLGRSLQVQTERALPSHGAAAREW